MDNKSKTLSVTRAGAASVTTHNSKYNKNQQAQLQMRKPANPASAFLIELSFLNDNKNVRFSPIALLPDVLKCATNF